VKIGRLLGLAASILGLVLLIFTFAEAFSMFTQSQGIKLSSDFGSNIALLIPPAVQVLFLGMMGWVGSLLMLRGIDFEKVERGVGVVSFKVDKGVGIVTQQQEEQQDKKSS
jgi:hypothetical protein